MIDREVKNWYTDDHEFLSDGDPSCFRKRVCSDRSRNPIGAKGDYISIFLKKTLVRISLQLLRGATFVQKSLRLFFQYALGVPLAWFGQRLFRLILIPLYSQYTKAKQRLKNNPHLAGFRSIGHFLQRYALYSGLIALGILGISNNLFAKTIRPDEVGRGAIWSAFSQNETSDLIVETTAAKPTRTSTTVALGGTPEAATNAPIVNTPVTTEAIGGATTSTGTDTQSEAVVSQYTVQGGDTISTIAENFGVSSRSILWANNLTDKDYIKPGQVLKIPSTSGYLYTVKSGDTLAGIAAKYKGDQQAILDANHLALADAIQPGQDIIIPNGEPPAPPTPAPTPQRTLLQQIFSGPDENPPPPSSAPAHGKFAWPTSGHHINQYYRGSFHTGVDIQGNYSSPIYAAASGTVEYAAFDRSGYGLHIVIDNGSGYETLYGHASKIFVHAGDHVTQGQTIAMIGSTGRSTGPHLHFEIRRGGDPTNPLGYY